MPISSFTSICSMISFFFWRHSDNLGEELQQHKVLGVWQSIKTLQTKLPAGSIPCNKILLSFPIPSEKTNLDGGSWLQSNKPTLEKICWVLMGSTVANLMQCCTYWAGPHHCHQPLAGEQENLHFQCALPYVYLTNGSKHHAAFLSFMYGSQSTTSCSFCTSRSLSSPDITNSPQRAATDPL